MVKLYGESYIINDRLLLPSVYSNCLYLSDFINYKIYLNT